MTTFTLGDCACITTADLGQLRRTCLAHTVNAAREALLAAIADVDAAMLAYRLVDRQIEEDTMRDLRVELSVALTATKAAQRQLQTIAII